MTKYILTQKAKENLKEIYKYGYNSFGEEQAEQYFIMLCERFEIITQHPLLYPSVEHILPNYRRSVCGRHTIYYKINSEKNLIKIIAILKHQDVFGLFE